MTGIRKKNKILGFIFAVLAVWMVIFQNPSYAAQRGSLNIKTEQAGMTVYLYRVAEKQAGVYVLNEKFQASGAVFPGVVQERLRSLWQILRRRRGSSLTGPEREAESMWFFGIFRMERLSTL